MTTGVDHYLGPYGSEKSRIRYGELIAEYSAGLSVDPFRPAHPQQAGGGLTVNELALAFMRHAATFYLKHGEPTSEIACFKLAIRPLVELYGFTPVEQFGPLALNAVRQTMIDKEWVRSSINRAVARIRHVFRWGVSQELVSSHVIIRLESVSALKAGRTQAKDNPARTAVDDLAIEKVKQDVSKLVADLIEIQRLTGCRSGELLSLTTAMIDCRQNVWLARLTDHKTAHHGQERTLAIGPKAQAIVTSYLRPDHPHEPLFNIRRTAYCRAITRSCERLQIAKWVPHQLRHTAATRVRDIFDLDHSQAVLGHAKSKQTEAYAKVTESRAVEVALKIG